MVEVDINGVPPGGKGPYSGSYSGSVSESMRRVSDFEKARRQANEQTSAMEAARNKKTPTQLAFEKLEAEAKARYSRETAQGYSELSRQEKQQRRDQVEAARKLRTTLKREVSNYDSFVSQQHKIQEEALKRQARDAAAAEALRKRQDMLAMQRGQQQWALQRNFSHIQHAANTHLTPRGWENVQHRAKILRERMDAFSHRWGVTPDIGGDLGAMLTGTGTKEGTFPIQNARRLGGIGQRAAENRDYTELVRIRREINRLLRVNEQQYKFISSPAEQANLDRQKAALEESRTRINAGLAGNSPLMNKMGMAWGGLAGLARNPVTEGILAGGAVALELATLPYQTAGAYSKWVGLQRPYLNWNLGTQGIARGYGWNGSALQRQLMHPMSIGSAYGHTLTPYDWLTRQAASLGIGPEDAVKRLQEYGVAPRNQVSAMRVLTQLRSAYLAPGNMMSEGALARGLGMVTSLGGVQPFTMGGTSAHWQNGTMVVGGHIGNTNQKFFDEMLKTNVAAVRRGIDASRFAESSLSFYRAAAQQGLGNNFSGLQGFYRSLLGSHAPGAATGALQGSIFAGVQQTLGQLGVSGTPSVNMAFLSAFGGHVPTTQAGLEKALGVKSGFFSQPGYKAALQQYLAAAKTNPVAALSILPALLSGTDPNIVKKFLEKSPYVQSFGPGWQPIVMQRLTNTNPTTYAGWSGAGGGGVGGVNGAFSRNLPAMAIAAAKNGVPLDVALAVFSRESSFGANMGPNKGHYGIGQDSAWVLRQYNKAKGTSYSTSDLMNPAVGSDVSMWYLSKIQSSYGLSWREAYAQHYDPEAGALADFNRRRQKYGGIASSVGSLAKLAGAQGAGLAQAEMVSTVSDAVVVGFHKAVGALDNFTTAVQHATAAMTTHRGFAGNMGMMGMPMIVPGGQVSK